jgi:ADP-ribose pyrophosphatase YjhB (NUDIX family)
MTIISYGIILYCRESIEPLFLLYQRRDSYEYMDIVRGAWNSEKRFRQLAISLCNEERDRLINYTFKELWDDLWVDHKSYYYKADMVKAMKKYESIRDKIPEIFNITQPIPNAGPPWGFPKGKRHGKESNIGCALREFLEETKIDMSTICVDETFQYNENYKGNDNKLYSTCYYVASCPNLIEIKRENILGCIRKSTISEEAGDVRWMTYSEAILKLCPRRAAILKHIYHLIILSGDPREIDYDTENE